MIVIGIDPGLYGAIALINDKEILHIWDMPIHDNPCGKGSAVDPVQLALILKTAKEEWDAEYAYVESVHSMPGQGVSSTFKFGASFGMLLGALAGVGLEFDLISPQKWKKHMGLTGQDKDQALILAKKLFFPADKWFKFKYHVDRADACLIGRCGANSCQS